MSGDGVQRIPVRLDDVRALVQQHQRRHAELIEAFHQLWYTSGHTWGMASYAGVPVLKNPLDLWVMAEIVHATRPTVIIETGTAFGGSALYLGDALERAGGPGMVISIDIEPDHLPARHPRVRYIRGKSSIDPELVASIRDAANARRERVMVILDSDHSAAHVEAELEAYAPLVTDGCYLVVEDTNLNGHPVPWEHGPGPAEGLERWRERSSIADRFRTDAFAERFLLTMFPGGWLRCYNPDHAGRPHPIAG